MSEPTRSKLITEAWDAAWNRGEVAALDALLAPDYRRISADAGSAAQDATALKASITAVREAFPDLRTTIDEIVVDAEGVRAAIRWHSEGTHEGRFTGIPATGRKVAVSGATFARFEGEQIAAEQVTWDPSALLRALGIIAVGQD
ncbi:ester cyclase [Streptomyces sp. NPDC047070]|uniref:ester cyclase n=1 Tax=Streptomyces sp. NPDC047070 TaxID=3154923 RepID=UPI0034568A3C